jgi:adenine-specific DNA-methyltransferase
VGDVSRIDTLLDQITDPSLRANLAREVADLAGKREFGLIYERHLPEIVRLPHGAINKGSTVMLRDGSDETVWRVTGVRNGVAALRDDDGNIRESRPSDLIAARVFGQPIYPGLRVTGRIRRGGSKPHHLVINGENHHALQALKYTHGRAVDVIYIDPPFPRKWVCCGVVCGHVEPDPGDVEAGSLAA